MQSTHDELAGVVDLFGALTRPELAEALFELAYRRGEDVDDDAVAGAVEDAVDAYALVEFDPEDAAGDGEVADGEVDGPLLLPGPVAFPSPPDDAEDLPHILDVEYRRVDRADAAESVARRLRAETARAVDEGDDDRARLLLDVSYDVESWGAVDLGDMRDRLDDVLA